MSLSSAFGIKLKKIYILTYSFKVNERGFMELVVKRSSTDSSIDTKNEDNATSLVRHITPTIIINSMT